MTGELRRLPAGWSAAEVPGAEGENFSGWLDRWIASESARLGAAATGGALLQAFAGDFGEGLGSESDAAELKGDRDAMLKSLTIAELQGAVIQLWKDQQELVSLLKLPLAERAQPLQRLSAWLQAAGALRTKADATLYFSRMLLAGVRVEYRKTAGGFELSCQDAAGRELITAGRK